MKIIGFVYTSGQKEIVLKGDSCLLNGRKPFFLPDWSKKIGVTPCVILRVSRLGKGIDTKFASRYYDAIAPGADFIALDKWSEAHQSNAPWTKSIAFDYSLAIGEWIDKPDVLQQVLEQGKWILSPEDAIARASEVMTIRQGDLIYIQACDLPKPVERGDVVRFEIAGEEKLYCKIK